MTKILLSFIVLLMSLQAYAYDMRISEAQLQEQLNARMPWQQAKSFVNLTINNALVDLLPEGNRVRVTTDAKVMLSIGLQSSGTLVFEGDIRYKTEDHSFYIDNPVIIDMQVEGMSPQLKPQVITLAQHSIEPALKDRPVYTLSDSDATQVMAKMMLKDLTIEKDEVILTLSPF
ncbi:MAG: DUF1439 domain-containing protein [Thalassolituus sp.]|uniref:DUF1439 domain-containing protein n=1 Tax=Thalassolituus sp. TaxID=2030822 RepID=UPI0039826C7A